MILTNENEKNILDWFRKNDFEPTNLSKLIEYLTKNNYIKTKEDILFENIELLDIKVPNIYYLDKNYIVNNDENYIDIGNGKYLNQYRIINEIYDGFFANDLIK